MPRELLRGPRPFSSSRGIVVLPGDLLEIMPPGAIRRMTLGRDPGRALDLDLGAGFPRFMDEWRAENGASPVPFAHLVTVAQTVAGDWERAAEMLRRGGYAEAAEDMEGLRREVAYARNWARSEWAPEQYRIGVREEVPEEAADLDGDQRRYLAAVASRIEDGLDGDAMQDVLYSTAGEAGLKPKAAFGAVYAALLGRKSGPKAGPFVAGLDANFVRERFREVAAGVPGGGDRR